MIRKLLQAAYLEFLNDYLTVETYASHNGLTVEQATKLIDLGREVHNQLVAEYKACEPVKPRHGESDADFKARHRKWTQRESWEI